MSLIYDGDLWSISSFVSGFENNAYLIKCARTGYSLIIDTPDNPVELLAAAEGSDVRAILITHNHSDHLQGFDAVMDKFRAPVGIGPADAPAVKGRAPDVIYVSGDTFLTAGDISVRAIPTPGHTPGSTCYMLPSERPGSTPHVFTGDTLFPGGPGKSDTPEAFLQILDSVEYRLLTLPAESIVLPGHGKGTTIEKARSEFAVFKSRSDRDGLFGEVTWAGD